MASANADEPCFDLKIQHFASLSKEKIDELMENRQAKKTRQATKSHLKLLDEFLDEKHMKKLEDTTDAELPEVLFTFYTNIRKEGGEMYKLASMKCIRASLNRHIKEKRNIDIISGARFIQANEMFRAVSIKTKKQGKAVTVSKHVIEQNDMKIIAEYFDNNYEENPDAKLLQHNVVFNILYFFVCQGRENLHQMKTTWFKVSLDPATNIKFVEQVQDEMDKNHSLQDTKMINEGRMYEVTGQNHLVIHQKIIADKHSCHHIFFLYSKCLHVLFTGSQICPLKMFELYISKLDSKCDYLWQKPRHLKSLSFEENTWYEPRPVGHTPLEKFMGALSNDLELSHHYTNYCITATGMTLLNEKGFEARHICAVSSHKNEATIRNYTVKCPDTKKCQI